MYGSAPYMGKGTRKFYIPCTDTLFCVIPLLLYCYRAYSLDVCLEVWAQWMAGLLWVGGECLVPLGFCGLSDVQNPQASFWQRFVGTLVGWVCCHLPDRVGGHLLEISQACEGSHPPLYGFVGKTIIQHHLITCKNSAGIYINGWKTCIP